MTRYRGFTMLELMAVVAVIGILAVLAVPTYMDRIVRDQVKAALPLADIAKPPDRDVVGACADRFRPTTRPPDCRLPKRSFPIT